MHKYACTVCGESVGTKLGSAKVTRIWNVQTITDKMRQASYYVTDANKNSCI